MLESVSASLAKKAHLDTKPDGHLGRRKSAGAVTVFDFITSSSSVVEAGKLPNFLDQCRSSTSSRLMLNMVKGHHLQIRCHPPLLCNFKWFNIKAAPAHHLIIQMEVDEMLAKSTTEPSTSGASFCSKIFVAPMHVGGLHQILNFMHFILRSNSFSKTEIFLVEDNMYTPNTQHHKVLKLIKVNIFLIPEEAMFENW